MTNVNFEIRTMKMEDLKAVLEIENQTFVHTWKEKDFIYELKENPVSNVWVIELDYLGNKVIAGFCDYWHTFDSATLCQIAVDPKFQRHKLGSQMMNEIINDCYAKKVRTITLEVRKSNAKAISFYEKFGFKNVVIKPHYYNDGEDAIYMVKEVSF